MAPGRKLGSKKRLKKKTPVASDATKPLTVRAKRKVARKKKAKIAAKGIGKSKVFPMAEPYQWVKGPAGKFIGAGGGNTKKRISAAWSLSKILKLQITEPANRIPLIKAKAIALGLDPARTTIGAVLAASVVCEVAMGDGTIFKEVMQRLEGKVKDELSVSGPPAVQFVFNKAKAPPKDAPDKDDDDSGC